MNRINAPAIYALLWLLSLLSALMFFKGQESVCVAFTVTALTTGLLFACLKHPFEKPVSRTFLTIIGLVCAFWFLALLSALTSEIFYVSFIYFGFFSTLPLSFFLTLTMLDKPIFRAILVKGLAAIALFLSLASILQVFFFPEKLFFGRVEWPLANPNSLAALLSLFWFFALGGALITQNRSRIFFILLSLLILWAIETTGSRGAFLALTIAALPLLFLLRKNISWNKKYLLIGLIVFLSGSVFIAMPLQTSEPNIAQRMGQTITGETSALWDSPRIWQATIEIARDHLLAGTGIGTFFLYYPQYRKGDLGSTGLMAHNDPLQFASEMGMGALLVFCALMISALIFTLRLIKSTKPQDPRRIPVLIPAGALAAMTLHSLITYNFYVLPCLVMAGVMLAYWLRSINEPAPEGEIYHAPLGENQRLLLKSGILALGCAGLFVFLMMQFSLILTDQAQAAARKGELDLFDRKIAAAENVSRGQNANIYLLASSLRLTTLQEHENALSKSAKDELTTQGLSFLQHAEKYNPRQPDIFYQRAGYYKLMGNDTATTQELVKCLQLNPAHLSSRQMLADLYAAKNKPKALELLKEGLPYVRINENTQPYLSQTATLALEQGDYETHNQAMKYMGRGMAVQTGRIRQAYEPRDKLNKAP